MPGLTFELPADEAETYPELARLLEMCPDCIQRVTAYCLWMGISLESARAQRLIDRNYSSCQIEHVYELE